MRGLGMREGEIGGVGKGAVLVDGEGRLTGLGSDIGTGRSKTKIRVTYL